MIFVVPYQSVITHFTKLFGKSGSLDVQIIRKLLPVKGNDEIRGVLLKGDAVQIGQHPSADGLWGGMKASAGKQKIFPGGYCKQICDKFIFPWI